MRKRSAQPPVEQLSVGFEGLEVAEPAVHEPAPDTMRQIVSLRMPDSLLERLEAAAHARGVSPSSLMRALIAAGLDRSYAAVQEDVASEISALRRQVAAIAARLGAADVASTVEDEPAGDVGVPGAPGA
jgi:predicted DNA-binding protein